MNNTQPSPATTPESTPESAAPERESEKSRKQPIPIPSEPKQYRAIGLVRGKYAPTEEELTRGTLTTDDGTAIDAVLLGRVISLIKNHLDLERSYLWVVYPRTRKEEEGLHVQIVGVWEPALLHNSDNGAAGEEDTPGVPEQMLQDGYFSVRGEAIYHSQDEEQVIVKIQQMPRKNDERRRFFKLHLNGVFPTDRPLGRFWDIHALLEGSTLTIQEAEDVGIILKKRRTGGGKKGGKRRPGATMKKRPSQGTARRTDGGPPTGNGLKSVPSPRSES